MVNENSDEEVKRKNIGLQSFLESIYTNYSKFYNQALPAIEKGEYYALIDLADGTKAKKIMTLRS